MKDSLLNVSILANKRFEFFTLSLHQAEMIYNSSENEQSAYVVCFCRTASCPHCRTSAAGCSPRCPVLQPTASLREKSSASPWFGKYSPSQASEASPGSLWVLWYKHWLFLVQGYRFSVITLSLSVTFTGNVLFLRSFSSDRNLLLIIRIFLLSSDAVWF